MAPVVYLLIGFAFLLGLGVALFLVRRTKAQMSDHFTSLATQVLEKNSETFLQIAKGELGTAQETAKGDLAQRQEAIKSWSNRSSNNWNRIKNVCSKAKPRSRPRSAK